MVVGSAWNSSNLEKEEGKEEYFGIAFGDSSYTHFSSSHFQSGM